MSAFLSYEIRKQPLNSRSRWTFKDSRWPLEMALHARSERKALEIFVRLKAWEDEVRYEWCGYSGFLRGKWRKDDGLDRPGRFYRVVHGQHAYFAREF